MLFEIDIHEIMQCIGHPHYVEFDNGFRKETGVFRFLRNNDLTFSSGN
jgi:hypothetical protein